MPSHSDYSASLVLASRFENIEIAERVLLDLCAVADHSADDRFWMVTALREALANAIRHGSRENAARTVVVAASVADGRAEIRVADHGEGFDPATIPDPTSPDHLLRPSGRGIFYMRQFMDRVDFLPAPGGGTEVVMTRELQSTARSDHDEE